MLKIFKTYDGILRQIDKPEAGCWVSLVAPTKEERAWLSGALDVEPEFVAAMFDDEERAHVDYDDDSQQTMIVLDCPFVEDKKDTVDPGVTQYDTHPLSVLLVPQQELIVTVSMRENATIQAFEMGKYRTMKTTHRTRMLLLMLLNVSQRYQADLRDIDRQFKKSERQLRENLRNRELMRMLGLEKSLVYFSISLRSLEGMLNKIGGRAVPMFDDDRELLDDVRIEFRQAVEMVETSSRLLSETMETFSNIIQNNMNDRMKLLTIITLILAVPTIVFSFYGMNVDDLPLVYTWWWPMTIAALGCAIAGAIFASSKFFK